MATLQHRAVDMEISSEAASKILAGEGAPPHTPSETSAVSKILGAIELKMER